MPARIHFIKKLGPGLVLLAHDGDQAIWSSCNLRKGGEHCAVTGEYIAKGTRVYRPIGNQQYRMKRIDADTLEKIISRMLEDEAKAEAGG